MENSQCEPCKALSKNKTTTHWCVICEENLCIDCKEHRRVQKIFRSHNILHINIKPTHINFSDQRCSKHENLSFEYFCIDHDSLCCKECQVESHRYCQKILSVDIASKGIKRSQSFIDAIELIEHGSEKQVFFAVHAYKTVLADLEQKISTITEQTTNLSIKLNTNLSNKSIMSIMSIGTIDTIEEPASKEFIQRKKRQSQIPVVQEQILPVFFKKQVVTMPWKTYDSVNGITVNHNNELIISTTNSVFGHRSIKVYDNNEKFNYEMKTRIVPWQIVSVSGHNRGIITSSIKDTIQFVDFNTCKLLNETSIEGCREGGVAASNENIFVGTNGNIKVLDHNGRHIRSIKMNNNELTPNYIVLDKIGNIDHSDSEVVYCTRIDGENIFTFKPPDNKSLNGIAIDSQGYVYVVVKNQGVCRLKPNGTFSDLVVNEDLDRLFEDICFNNDCTKLYISYENGVLVYTRQ